jgi:hypothetical protein
MAKYTLTIDDQIDAGFLPESEPKTCASEVESAEIERVVLVRGESYIFTPPDGDSQAQWQEPWFKGTFAGHVDRSYFDEEEGKYEFWYEYNIVVDGETVGIPDYYIGRRAA